MWETDMIVSQFILIKKIKYNAIIKYYNKIEKREISNFT